MYADAWARLPRGRGVDIPGHSAGWELFSAFSPLLVAVVVVSLGILVKLPSRAPGPPGGVMFGAATHRQKTRVGRSSHLQPAAFGTQFEAWGGRGEG